MRCITLFTVAIMSGLALALPTFAATDRKTLTGTDGPGFTITMSKKTVKSGTYRDRHPRPLVDPQLPPDRTRRKQEDKRPRCRHDHLDRETEEGHLQVRLRPPRRIMHGVLKVT